MNTETFGTTWTGNRGRGYRGRGGYRGRNNYRGGRFSGGYNNRYNKGIVQ